MPSKEISKETAEKIKVNGELPAVVFSVDKKGQIQSYRVKGCKASECNFPLPAGDIKSMETITLFETSNPKTCWINSSGQLECIEW